ARPGQARGARRGEHDRLGRLGAQWRILRRQPHARLRQRSGPPAEENERLAALGRENLDAIEAAVARYGMDCEFERTGELDVATEDYQVAELREAHDPDSGFIFFDQQQLATMVKSPTYKAALWDSREVAMVNPAKLCWELLRVIRGLGVEVFEGTK